MNKYRCNCGAFISPGRSCRRCGNRAYHGLDYLDCMADYTQYQEFQFVGDPLPDIPPLPPAEPIDWQLPDLSGKMGRIAGAIGIGIIDSAVPGAGTIIDIARIIAETGGES